MPLARKALPATIDDLLAIPEVDRFHEIIAGNLVRKAMPSFRHGGAQAGLTSRIGGPYGRRPGGRWPGGWRFATETEIQFEEHEVFRPDVAGWRRERLPEIPRETPVIVLPDWICEIMSPSNSQNDVVWKMRVYQRCRIAHYWIIDPIAETLLVYRWQEDGYLVAQSSQGNELLHAEPFDAVGFSVRGLIEGDEDAEGGEQE